MTLAEWIKASGKPRWIIARELGVSGPSITELCKGRWRPGLELAFRIERLTDGKVPAAEWITEQPK